MRSTLARLPLYLTALFLALVSFAGTALAAGAAAPEDGSLLDLLRPAFDLVMSGHYVAASAAALVLLVALVRRYAPGKLGAFVHSDIGGALTTLIGAFGGALAAAVGAGSLTLAGVWTALGVAVGAAGGYTLISKLLAPLEARAPAWLRPLFRIVTWILDKPDPAIAAAAAGDAAVKTSPSTGVAGVVGGIDELK